MRVTLSWFAALCSMPAVLLARADVYYGHVSYIASGAPSVGRANGKTLQATLNFPIGPGDSIETGSGELLEITFDTGTVLFIDADTTLRIDTINATGISSGKAVTNLSLERGAIYVDYERADRSELFQILTDQSATKLSQRTEVTVAARDGTLVRVHRGKSHVLYGPDRDDAEKKKLGEGRALSISPQHVAEPAGAHVEAELDRFVAARQSVHEAKRRARGPMPRKTASELPTVVNDFVREDAYRYGEWIDEPAYGSVWRPYANDAYPLGRWQPFVYGSWTPLMGEAAWVPLEPWGWVPYHFGLWTWDARYGWLWIPGGQFSPARVVWDYDGSLYGWRPVTMADWFWMTGILQYRNHCTYVLSFEYGSCRTGQQTYPNPRNQPAAVEKTEEQPVVPLPTDLEPVYRRVARTLERGKHDVMPDHTVVVSRDDIHAPRVHERRVVDRRAGPTTRAVPIADYREAFRTPAVRRGARARPSFRDWNPDARAAARLGTFVTYSTERNQVLSPELRRNVTERRRGRALSEEVRFDRESATRPRAQAVSRTNPAPANAPARSRERASQAPRKKKN